MILWLAQGFGVGRIPFAPGTFGSLVGLLWFLVLLASGNLWVFIAGTVAGIACSVWLCGAGEKILGQTDPGSIVMDEIAATPLCLTGWIGTFIHQHSRMPHLDYFEHQSGLLLLSAVFVLFRIFDIAKPWPVKQSQVLPGGWGVTIDDCLAAVYVNMVLLVAMAVRPGLWVSP